MGDVNQLRFITDAAENLDGPFLEIGSKNYGSTQNLRPLFSNRGDYVGVDMATGDGVDCVVDLTQSFENVDVALSGKRFRTIFCLSVLEHCAQPFAMADNIVRLLAPGGQVVISAPFAWKFHGYPSDYWRFTHEGIKQLFPMLAFDDEQCFVVTSRKDEFRPIDNDLARISLSSGYYRERGRTLRAFGARVVRFVTRLGLFRWIADYRYVMPPTNVMMVGRLRDEPAARAA